MGQRTSLWRHPYQPWRLSPPPRVVRASSPPAAPPCAPKSAALFWSPPPFFVLSFLCVKKKEALSFGSVVAEKVFLCVGARLSTFFLRGSFFYTVKSFSPSSSSFVTTFCFSVGCILLRCLYVYHFMRPRPGKLMCCVLAAVSDFEKTEPDTSTYCTVLVQVTHTCIADKPSEPT